MAEYKMPITQKSDRLLELLYKSLVKCDLQSKKVNDCRIKSVQNLKLNNWYATENINGRKTSVLQLILHLEKIAIKYSACGTLFEF